MSYEGGGELPRSLWKLVEESVPVSERDEIRQLLGLAAVDLSLDLHAEVAVLVEIWREMKLAQSLAQSRVLKSVLPESASVKSLLRQEIQLLLLNIQKQALEEGRNENEAISSYDRNVVSFALGQSRPGSGSIQESDSTDGLRDRMSPLSRPNPSPVYNAEDLKDKLNIQNIDDIMLHLQSILQEECNLLTEYILFLQNSLEEEHQNNWELVTINREPSIAELKEERKMLERDLQLTSSMQNLALSPILSGPASSQVPCRNEEPSSGGRADQSRRVTFPGRSETNLETGVKVRAPPSPIKYERPLSLHRPSLLIVSDTGYQGEGPPPNVPSELPIEQLSTPPLGQAEIPRFSTEKARTLPPGLRSPTEALPLRAKLEGRILVPTPPSAEKPMSAQPIPGRRARRAQAETV